MTERTLDKPPTTLVVGATGATGRLLVSQLLRRGCPVRALVRPGSALPAELKPTEGLTVIRGMIAEADEPLIREWVDGCGAIASCLGHAVSVRGMYLDPHRLVTDAVRRLSQAALAVNRDADPIRFVLMNSSGCRDPGNDHPVSRAQTLVLALLRALVPPHADNEQAAAWLREGIGVDHPGIGWVVVRPDALQGGAEHTPYTLHPGPTRSAIFDSGTTRRANVAHFMAALIADPGCWAQWRGRSPVIYDREGSDTPTQI